jgi:hypothetical protein
MNDSLYTFNDRADSNNDSIKLNMDELYVKKQQQDLNVLNNYNKILVRIHNKIKYTSRQLVNDNCCWYIMPEIMIGMPKYNHLECSAYIIEKLRENGFVVRYTHPNLLFISWKNWIPSYVRNEIKKKTGYNIDEYGNIISNNEVSDENKKEINNILNNSKDKDKDKNKNNYKDTKTYQPSGNLIYANNLLKKLDINS